MVKELLVDSFDRHYFCLGASRWELEDQPSCTSQTRLNRKDAKQGAANKSYLDTFREAWVVC